MNDITMPDLAKADEIIQQAAVLLKPYRDDIPDSEFQKLSRAEEKRRKFVDGFIEESENHQEYLPGFITYGHLKRDFQRIGACKKVTGVMKRLERQLCGVGLTDGDNLYKVANVYISNLRAAARRGDMEAQELYEKLSKLKPRTGGINQ
jgi:hypothetical protein